MVGEDDSCISSGASQEGTGSAKFNEFGSES